jgi:perosamine synthetase
VWSGAEDDATSDRRRAVIHRVLPPSGTPVPWNALAASVRSATSRRRAAAEARSFEIEVARLMGVSLAHLLSSGRAALVVAMRLLARPLGGRGRVVLPAYTCYSVAASAVRAGLDVVPVDIDPETMSYDLDALNRTNTKDVVALASANHFGNPDPLEELEAFAHSRGIGMIDDAAQAMGARVASRSVGTFGSLGVLSLDKGKNITTIQGGFLIVNDPDMERDVSESVQALPPPSRTTGLRDLAKLGAYSVLLRPRLYGIPNALLPLGVTPFDTAFPVTRYPEVLAASGRLLIENLDALTAARRERAHQLRAALEGVSGIRVPRSASGESACLRLPILVEDPARRDPVLRALRAEGLGGSGFYPKALPDVPELPLDPEFRGRPYPGARWVASRLLTLPTHPYVTSRDVDRIARSITRIL